MLIKTEGKYKMNKYAKICIVLIPLVVVIWYCYNFIPYKVNIEFVDSISLGYSIHPPNWQVVSLEYYKEEINKDFDTYEIELDKLNNYDSDKYNVLVARGGEIETIKKTRYKYSYSGEVQFKANSSSNIMTIYIIDKNIKLLPIYP